MKQLQNPAYVMGGSLNALGIVRALGREGIPVYLVHSSTDTIARSSKFAKFLLSPSPEKQPEELVDFLNRFQGKMTHPGVIIPTSDVAVLFLARYGNQLEKNFRFVIPEPRLIEKFASKEGFDELAQRHHFPAPRTFIPRSEADLATIADQLDFPCIIKPFYSHKWRDPRIVKKYGWIKVLQLNNKTDLMTHYRYLAQVDPQMVVQEFIHGDDEANYSLHIYLPRDGSRAITFVGKKIRVAPIHYGVGAFVESVAEPEMERLGKEFLIAVHYRGMAVINFKKDPVRHKIYGIELNPRFSLWNYLDYASGINFAHLYYLDSLEQSLPLPGDYQTGVKWVSIEKDISAFFSYHREHLLSFSDWIKSYRGKKAFAEFAADDPGPFFRWMAKMLGIFIFSGSRRLFRKISGKMGIK